MTAFCYNALLTGAGDTFQLPGMEGYILQIQGVYISVGPDSYSLASGPANIVIGPLEGLPSSRTIVITFVPATSDCVNLPVDLEARAIGDGQPVTFTLNTGGGQSLSNGVNVNVWGQLIPAAA